MVIETVLQAQAHFCDLIAKARAGETVLVTGEDGGPALVKIVAIGPQEPRRLGFMEMPGFEIPESFWEPLTDEECGVAGE